MAKLSRLAAQRIQKSSMQHQLLHRALNAHRAGHAQQAETLYQQILAANPRHPDALHLLGVLQLQRGDPAGALDLISKASQLQPRNWAFLADLAQAFFALQRYADAGAAFRTAAGLKRDDPELQIGAANCLALQGQFMDAERALRQIARRFPAAASVWFNLANTVCDQGRFEEAIPLYQRAARLAPEWFELHNNLGRALHATEKFDEAAQAYRKCLALKADYIPAMCNLVSVLIDGGRFSDAENICIDLLQQYPDFAEAQLMLGSARGFQGRQLEALGNFAQAARLDPGNPRAAAALGMALYQAGRTDEAGTQLAQALKLAPDFAGIHEFLAYSHLAQGAFKTGWREYAQRPARARFIAENTGVALVDNNLPEDLLDKHILLLREQGLGDELFFLRFAGQLKARGARITCHTSAKIKDILARVAALDRVLVRPEPIPSADFTLLVGDLPLALGSAGAFDPVLPPPLALTPLPHLRDSIRQRLAEFGPPPYLGLTWRGGIAPEAQRGTHWALFKQLPLEQLGDTLHGIEGTFLALQRNPAPGEIDRLGARLGKPLHDLTALNEDLEAMLALLALIDDYIGVSNTNMHLRAGTGKTARVLVPCPAEWRWMANGNESPWFPGFRIYRQQMDGDWNEALIQLRCDLGAAFGTRQGTSALP